MSVTRSKSPTDRSIATGATGFWGFSVCQLRPPSNDSTRRAARGASTCRCPAATSPRGVAGCPGSWRVELTLLPTLALLAQPSTITPNGVVAADRVRLKDDRAGLAEGEAMVAKHNAFRPQPAAVNARNVHG